MIDIQIFQDVGPITNGRGTPIQVTNWNMKNSAAYNTVYFPSKEIASAPMVRPLVPGEQLLSYKVFTYFKLTGTFDKIKNLRFRISMPNPPEASNAQLFFKMTNIYETPTNAFDGDMILLADKDGSLVSDLVYPKISTVGPNSATTRNMVYTGNTSLYTNYFVTQMRVNEGSSVGNTAEFELNFEAYEYGDF